MNAQSEVWSAVGKPLKGFGGGRYRLTPEFLFFETGGLSTNAQQIPTAHIMDVDMRQSMIQKQRDIATLHVHVTRPDGAQETATLDDVPDYRNGVSLINQVAAHARDAFRRASQTQRFEYGSPASPGAPSAPSQDGGSLRQLVEMHQRGAIGDDVLIAEVYRVTGVAR